MPARGVDSLPDLQYRIGRYPDPLALPPFEAIGHNRFDDPRGEFRVLYAAEQRLACFVETLAPFRPDIELLTQLLQMPPGDRRNDVPEAGLIPAEWRETRRSGSFRLAPGQRWLDLRLLETREALRQRLAATLQRLGYRDFDMSDILSRDRRLTQAIARWASEEDYQGIVYTSRFDPALDCWAIFEGADYSAFEIAPIAHNDGDLLRAMLLLNLWIGR